MLELPQYHDPSRELETIGNQKRTTKATVSSKRQKWLRDASVEFKFKKQPITNTEKPQIAKKNQKKCTNNIETIAIVKTDNDKKKYKFDWKKSKLTIEQINNNILITDKKAFTDWFINTYSKSQQKKQSDIPQVNSILISHSNYYKVLQETEGTVETTIEYNKITDIEDTNTNKQIEKMPLLTPKTYAAPVFDTYDEYNEHTDEVYKPPENEWTYSNQKEINKEMRITFSPTSMYHLPQTIPYVKASNHEIQPTKYVLPLSI
jgi:hypothetical protein